MEKHGFVSRVHRKNPQGRPMSETTRRANSLKSKACSRVEHVSAVQMDLFIRTVGKIGMANPANHQYAKKLLFAGTEAGGDTWAIIGSFPTTAIINDTDPRVQTHNQ